MRNAAFPLVLALVLALGFLAPREAQALPEYKVDGKSPQTLSLMDNKGVRAYLEFSPEKLLPKPATGPVVNTLLVDFSIVVLDASQVPARMAAKYLPSQPISVLRFVFYEKAEINGKIWLREITHSDTPVTLHVRYLKAERQSSDPNGAAFVTSGVPVVVEKGKSAKTWINLPSTGETDAKGFSFGALTIDEDEGFLSIPFLSWPEGDPAADGD
jgi:hypothetical protein